MKMAHYKSPEVGQEISCVMKGMEESVFLNKKLLIRLIETTLKKFKFKLLKTSFHVFQPNGLTLIILLAESHLAIHTYPEHNSLYFNLYSCRGPKDAELVFEEIKKKLKPREIIYFKKEEIPITN